jgi:hypothetical protein
MSVLLNRLVKSPNRRSDEFGVLHASKKQKKPALAGVHKYACLV